MNHGDDETSSQPVAHRVPGVHDIEREIISSHNEMFILHDSEGFGDRFDDAYGCKIDNFIQGRRKQLEIKDRLHAIW